MRTCCTQFSPGYGFLDAARDLFERGDNQDTASLFHSTVTRVTKTQVNPTEYYERRTDRRLGQDSSGTQL